MSQEMASSVGHFLSGGNILRSAARAHLDRQDWSRDVGFRPAFTLPLRFEVMGEEAAEAEE